MKTLKLSMISAAVITAMGMSSAYAADGANNETTLTTGATVKVNSSTTVVKKCTTLTGGTISFDAYVPDSTTDNTKSTTISVKCTLATPVNISMNAGKNSSDTSVRKLLLDGGSTSNAGESLQYSLYSDSSHTTVWDSVTGVDFNGLGLKSTKTLTVYGKIPAAQDVKTGSFSDEVTVTLTY